MAVLLFAGRSLKLLCDELAERLEKMLLIVRRQDLPQLIQRQA
jgi:hypothetical protein